MLVIRVESSDGWGMYCNGAVHWDNCWDRNPNTYQDMGVRYSKFGEKHRDYRHGFNSIDMMWQWFHSSAFNVEKVMERCQISVYEVPSEFVEVGCAQIIFAKEKAKLLRVMSVKEFLWRQRSGLYIVAEPDVGKVMNLQAAAEYRKPKAYLQFKQAPRSAKKYA